MPLTQHQVLAQQLLPLPFRSIGLLLLLRHFCLSLLPYRPLSLFLDTAIIAMLVRNQVRWVIPIWAWISYTN